MVEAWNLLVVGVPVLTVVLGVLGGLALTNRKKVNALYQRLLGHPDDGTDTGFIEETEERLENLDSKVEDHAQTTHQQLRDLDDKVDTLIGVVVDEHDVEDLSVRDGGGRDARVPRSPDEVFGDGD